MPVEYPLGRGTYIEHVETGDVYVILGTDEFQVVRYGHVEYYDWEDEEREIGEIFTNRYFYAANCLVPTNTNQIDVLTCPVRIARELRHLPLNIRNIQPGERDA